jgi:uncharacterized oligopeptide transporter (OPT) family protein
MVVGTILTLLGRSRYARFVPSPTAIALAFLSPMSLTVTVFLGAIAAALFRRRWPKTADESLMTVAAGGVAGESIMGVMIAVLIAFGII